MMDDSTDSYIAVKSWGSPVIAKRSNRKKKSDGKTKPVELFKLYLGGLPDNLKPYLPYGLDYKKFITDYLKQIGEVRIKSLKFFKIILIFKLFTYLN
jgi:hypothetical protein